MKNNKYSKTYQYYYIVTENNEIRANQLGKYASPDSILFYLFETNNHLEQYQTLFRENENNVKSIIFDSIIMSQFSNLTKISIYSKLFYYFIDNNGWSIICNSYEDCILDFMISVNNYILFEKDVAHNIIKLKGLDELLPELQKFEDNSLSLLNVILNYLLTTQNNKGPNKTWIKKFQALSKSFPYPLKICRDFSKEISKKHSEEVLQIKSSISKKNEDLFKELATLFTYTSYNGGSNYLWFYKFINDIQNAENKIEYYLGNIVKNFNGNTVARNYYFSKFAKTLLDIKYCYSDSKLVFFYECLLKNLSDSYFKKKFNMDLFIDDIKTDEPQIKFLKFICDGKESNQLQSDDKSIKNNESRKSVFKFQMIDYEFNTTNNKDGRYPSRLLHIEKFVEINMFHVYVFEKKPSNFSKNNWEYKKLREYQFKHTNEYFRINNYRFDFLYTVFFKDFMDLIINVIAVYEQADTSFTDVFTVVDSKDSKLIYNNIKDLIK